MTQTEILNSNQTKTWKIQQLLNLGLSRTETARLMNCGYGFVQNVYARMNRTAPATNYSFSNFTFCHDFGVEIEAFGISRDDLARELRFAGIDCYVETYNHQTRSHWKIVTDSSVQGNNTFELVSPILSGMTGLRQLKTVLLIVRGLEAKVNKSCGLHIHFNAEHFNLTTWKNILWNYATLEPTIDSFMPYSRRANNNGYCRTMQDRRLESTINSLSGANSLTSELSKLRNIYGNDRFRKVNLQSFLAHRSLEFRQHSGTVSYQKIENWILFLARLIEFSRTNKITGNANFETLKNFLDEDLINFYESRISELN